MEQSNEPRRGAHHDGGALVRLERRRHWSDEDKLAILKEATQPGAIIAAIARRYGIGSGQLYTWSKQLLRVTMAGFVPVELVQPEPSGKMVDAGRIDIRRGGGFMVSVVRLVDRQALCLVLEIVGELDR